METNLSAHRQKFHQTLSQLRDENGGNVLREMLYRFLMVQMRGDTGSITPPDREPPGKLLGDCQKIFGELFEKFVTLYIDGGYGSETDANRLVKQWITDFYRTEMKNND